MSLRRTDGDATRTLLFLVQAPYLIPTWSRPEDYAVYRTRTAAELVNLGLADWAWRTVGVFLTRQEADDYCARQYSEGPPFRSFSVPCGGALEELLMSSTDSKGQP